MTLERGTQVVYVPGHANGDINHKDCEFGFVTSLVENLKSLDGNDAYFCRFYFSRDSMDLRTRSASELTYAHNLVVMDHHPQEDVDMWIAALY